MKKHKTRVFIIIITMIVAARVRRITIIILLLLLCNVSSAHSYGNRTHRMYTLYYYYNLQLNL